MHPEKSSRPHDDDAIINEGFIGNDGNRHDYEYDGKNYVWRTHMTNEEFYMMNDRRKLESCAKCPLWKKCKAAEHTVVTTGCVVNKNVDEITREINTRILEGMDIR